MPQPEKIAMEFIVDAYEPGEGRHWFDAKTMKFFGTRLPQAAYLTANGKVAYFVTSEQPPHGPRAYAVRRFDFASRNISTVGDLAAHATSSTATVIARNLAAKGE